MKYTEVADIITGFKTNFAIFSTYEFDPIYFERRLLGSSGLEGSRRIIIFMDKRCYQKLGSLESRPRYLNERYLVVPVLPDYGVYHPKLSLLIGEDSDLVLCGSCNLTQSGFASNLELINALNVPRNDPSCVSRYLPARALQFFRACLTWSEESAKRTVSEWFAHLESSAPWLASRAVDETGPVLIESTQRSLWDSTIAELGNSRVKKIVIISPYFDRDLRLLGRLRKSWPGSPIEIISQEHTGSLPASLLAKNSKDVTLYKINAPNNRRLHAKLIAFVTSKETICIVGSANFTSAAFDKINIETCLVVRTAEKLPDTLFDGQLRYTKISPEDFVAGDEDEPKPTAVTEKEISLISASLSHRGQLHVHFKVSDQSNLDKLSIGFQMYGEDKPGRMLGIPVGSQPDAVIAVIDSLTRELHDAVRCILLGTRKDGSRVQSNAVYLIQEASLAYESAGARDSTDREKIIRETGRGATEYLDILAEREGSKAVIDFLRYFNIKFKSGLLFRSASRQFRLVPYDPTLSDKAPEWLKEVKLELEEAIFDFVDRHHYNVLRKHAAQGNINGLSNFLDVFVECNKLLYVYYRRGKVRRFFAMEKILRGVGMMTIGYKFCDEDYEGYTNRMLEEMDNSAEIIRSAFNDTLVAEHLCIGLLMSQLMHVGEDAATDPTLCLPKYKDIIQQVCSNLDLRIDEGRLSQALNFYPLLSEGEKRSWKKHVRRELAH